MQADPQHWLKTPGASPAPGLLDESARLQVLHALALDPAAPSDPALDAVVRAARRVSGCSIAMVTLVDDAEALHVARDGFDLPRTPRALAFCSLAIRGRGFFEVPDLREDPRFAQHPMVSGTGSIRHYAAAPLVVEGQALGTLCVLDAKPGPLPEDARDGLQELSIMAAQWLVQRHRLQRLQGQTERLSDLVRATGDWAWELDEQFRLTWLDGELPGITGHAPHELLGRHAEAEPLVDSCGQPLPQGGTLLDVLARQQPFTRVLTRMSCPGGSLLVSRSAQPVFDLQGRFRGYRGASRDVTAGLERESLLRDKAALEASQRNRSAFLSRVSHELRTPLNAILGFTQLMAMDHQHPLPPSQAQRLDGVRRAGQHLLELVDDVLEVVRLGQGGRAMTLAPLVLADAVTQEIAHQQALAQAHQVQLHGEVPAGLLVRADARALAQVLGHLLSNAIKYNRSGGQVTVRAAREGRMVRLLVEDTGLGLEPHELEQLFQPFQRPGAERRRVPGSGLGLVLVRELVGAMQGHVDARSTPGVGSSFSVELPADEPVPEASAAAEAPATRRVLYIEDEPLNVLLLQEVFKARPEWTLQVARDGLQGVADALARPPDLALIDMNLPDISGMEVLRRLRADPRTRDLRCIALSADAMSEQVLAARAAGFDDYWTKPIDLRRLLEAVAEALTRH